MDIQHKMKGFIFTLTLLPALCWAVNEPGYFITAPDMIRVGVSETVLVSLRNTGGTAIPIKLSLESFPRKDVIYAEETIEVESNEPQTATLRIDPSRVPAVDEGVKQYVYLIAKSLSESFPFQKETVILMSYKSGYVFIQTDKPIYTPDHDVKIRVISLNQSMRPSDTPIRLEIRNPQDLIVKVEESAKSDTGFITETFRFPTHPPFGTWSVVAYYGHKHQHNTTVEFLVKEYVLPTFSVTITPGSNYILRETREVLTTISSYYVFGEPVQGSYHIRYSALSPSGDLRYLAKQSGDLDNLGKAVPRLETEALAVDWFDQHRGSRLHIQAYVTEQSSGLTESSNSTQVMIVSTPYVIKWDHTARFFKRDLPFEVKAQVFNANGRPAAHIQVSVVAKATTSSGTTVILGGEEQNGIPEDSFKTSDHLGHVKYNLNVPSEIEQINITLSTVDPELPVSSSSLIVDPQQSPSGDSFLLARIRSDRINVDHSIQVDLQKTDDTLETTLHLLVVSGGQIVAHKTTTSDSKNVVMDMDVTFDMVPHARLVAYYINGQNQVIADSAWFDVNDQCDDDFSISLPSSEVNQKYEPGESLSIQVRGTPYTKVGLLAVDEAVYMLKDYHRLTDKKMFSAMSEYDLGCGPGGGINMAAIFMDSGVAVITDADLVIPSREDESCGESSSRRNRRSATTLDNMYPNDPRLQESCNLGAQLTTGDTTPCKVRTLTFAASTQISLDDARIMAYFNCCLIARNNLDRGRTDLFDVLPEEEFDDPNADLNERVRSFFPDTWIFDEVEIGPYGIQNYRTTTPDSITTWRIQAVGVSSTHGMCVAQVLPVRVQPDFFIIMHLPYSVIRMEQVEIVATIFNYYHQNLSVRVFLRGVHGVCSESQPGEYSQPKEFNIRPQDSVTVKYNIVPLEIGEFPLEIFVATARGNDAVEKILKVIPEGVKRERVIPVVLDPSGVRRQLQARANGRSASDILPSFHPQQIRNEAEGRQTDFISVDLPRGSVPDSASVSVNIRGNLMGSTITTVIEGLDDILEMPRGCGEQTMLYMAPNAYVLKYLKETGQLTSEIESVVFRYIEEGITRQLAHRREDGSFAIWGENENYPSSTWLTAFVNKVFCQAKEFSYVDPKITCSAIDWLISNAQRPNGSFRELYKVHHKEMTGGLEGDATMTAFVLISLLECDCDAVLTDEAVINATKYLESQVSSLARPYEMAVVTYALALAGGNNLEEAVEMMKGVSTFDTVRNIRYWAADASSLDPANRPYWYEYRPSAIAVESTAYALLALLKLGEVSYVHPIVNWLTEQRNYNGGFESTQDTVIALQALSEYAIQTSGDEVSLECTITNDVDASYRHSVTVHSGNALIQQSFKGPNNGQLIVDTIGTGVGELAVRVKYHTVDENGERCPYDVTINTRESRSGKFDDPATPISTSSSSNLPSRSRVGIFKRDISRSRIGTEDLSQGVVGEEEEEGMLTPEERGRAKGDFVNEVEVCVLNIGNRVTNMAIIDVGLYSGFKPVKESLDSILREPRTLVQRYEINDRSVIFYVEEIPRDDRLCVRFNTIREFVVGKVQAVAVRVYDYYSPDQECISFYHPHSASVLLSTVCQGETCICAAGNCPKRACLANLCETTYSQLNTLICNNVNTFAYRVSFNNKRISNGFEIHELNVLSVLSIGNDFALEESLRDNPDVPVVREFWKSLNCHELKIGSKKEYIVIGTGGLKFTDDDGQQSYKYILDSNYLFEDWPTGKRATRSRFVGQVLKLDQLRTQMESQQGGCQT